MSSSERCHHIKTSGTQCGSPALRGQRFCYYHQQYRPSSVPTYYNEKYPLGEISMPEFEDAHSIQFVLRQVVKLTLEQRLDRKTATLVLYAMQIASSNLKRMALETPDPQQVCTDPEHPEIACGDSAIHRHGEEQAAQQKQLAEHKNRMAALRHVAEQNKNHQIDTIQASQPAPRHRRKRSKPEFPLHALTNSLTRSIICTTPRRLVSPLPLATASLKRSWGPA